MAEEAADTASAEENVEEAVAAEGAAAEDAVAEDTAAGDTAIEAAEAAAGEESAEEGAEETGAEEAQAGEASGNLASESAGVADRETLSQAALFQSLAQGYYDGVISVGELKELGDTGIGTFEGLDGELIMLDGEVYRAASDSSVDTVEDETMVPFANVTFFDEDGTLELTDIADLPALEEALDAIVQENGRNLFYMVKIHGMFTSLKVRSESRQEKPYRPIDEALAADQVDFNYADIRGTMVGLYCPDFMAGVNAPGWHFHFVSEGRALGGHVLEANIQEANVSYDVTPGFSMILSTEQEFQNMDLAKDVSDVINTAERYQASEGTEGSEAEGTETESEETGEAGPGSEGQTESQETLQERLEGSTVTTTEAAASTEAGTENTESTEAGTDSGSEGTSSAEGTKPEDSSDSASKPAGNTASDSTYIVQEGDTLYSIADKLGLDPEIIAELNKEMMINFANENGYDYVGDYDYIEYIFPGEELILPGADGKEIAH